jgi:hypothetical protein
MYKIVRDVKLAQGALKRGNPRRRRYLGNIVVVIPDQVIKTT